LSLIGIDVGSTGTKLTAFNQEGKTLGSVYAEHTPYHPFPGTWELDPEDVWAKTRNELRQLVEIDSIRHDPPRVIAICASTREGFPVDADGKPLGPCIMTADTRESGLENSIANHYSPDAWFSFCGHLPERMDPVCRMLWWKRNHPTIMSKAKYFLGWGEFLSLRLTGHAVVDRSHAGRFFVYDFKTNAWSNEHLSEFGINRDILPEIKPWGTIAGGLRSDVAAALGLRNNVELAVGANDLVCSVLGAGVSHVGTGCMISGSWENILLPVKSQPPTSDLINAGVSLGPYPGLARWMIYCLSPTGNAALNWVRSLVNETLDASESSLRDSIKGPGHVLAIPHVSGATTPWVGGSNLRGALLGMTLATSPTDVVKAVMESIVYDTSYLISALRAGSVKVDLLRGVGGGIRSKWWTQLKADLTNTPIETVDQAEIGTLGAALLAGKAAGFWDDMEKKAGEWTRPNHRYEPDVQRASLYMKRMEFYKSLIIGWLEKDWSGLVA
jgi:xylulokinase